MQLQGMRYFISANGGQTGRIEEYDSELLICAENLDNKLEYSMFYCVPGGRAVKIGSVYPNAGGQIKETLHQNNTERTEGFYVVTCREKICLFEPLAPMDVLRTAIWNYWAVQHKKETAPTTATENLLPGEELGVFNHDTGKEAQDAPSDEETVNYKEYAGNRQSADLLPALQWPEKVEKLKRYFDQCNPEPLPLAQGAYWRFVRAPAAAAPYSDTCLLGRHVEKGKINAVAYALDASLQAHFCQIPGFKYQKTPDGRGLWIYMEEVRETNL